MRHVGVVIADRGSAVVTVEHDDDERLVTGIERLPFDLAAVAAWVRAFDPETMVVIDADGLGNALWAVLGRPEGWQLYTGRGMERQALVDELLVAIEESRFRFASGLTEQEAMTRALLSYRRHVREDGLIGSELVVALLLALIPPPEPPNPPLAAWDSFDGADELDGISVGGIRLRRAPDGTLVAIAESKEKDQ